MLNIDKRAQITIFIIIGVILLLSLSIVIVIRTETSKVFVEKFLLPEEIIPIREYTQNCLESVSREAINRIGANGGFIDIPDIIRLNPKARLDIFPEAGVMLPLPTTFVVRL